MNEQEQLHPCDRPEWRRYGVKWNRTPVRLIQPPTTDIVSHLGINIFFKPRIDSGMVRIMSFLTNNGNSFVSFENFWLTLELELIVSTGSSLIEY